MSIWNSVGLGSNMVLQDLRKAPLVMSSSSYCSLKLNRLCTEVYLNLYCVFNWFSDTKVICCLRAAASSSFPSLSSDSLHMKFLKHIHYRGLDFVFPILYKCIYFTFTTIIVQVVVLQRQCSHGLHLSQCITCWQLETVFLQRMHFYCTILTVVTQAKLFAFKILAIHENVSVFNQQGVSNICKRKLPTYMTITIYSMKSKKVLGGEQDSHLQQVQNALVDETCSIQI